MEVINTIVDWAITFTCALPFFGFRAEKNRACPVLLEPNPLPMDHSPAFYVLGRTARVQYVFLPIQRYLFQREQV